MYYNNMGQGLLGWATFPSSYAKQPEGSTASSSCTRRSPAASAAPYNLGDTATHEVGHWMGLYHTFQGGCSSRQRATRRATRPPSRRRVRLPDGPRHLHRNNPGLDPIKNFMDYTDDAA